ncbi:hypothetical protein D3C79_1062970 [compost metagenome]
MKLLRTHHQAGEVDIEHSLETLGEKFLTVVEHRALCLHQHIQAGEGYAGGFNQRRVRDIDLGVVQAFEI